MAHYAFLDENNIVCEVIVGKNENQDGINWEEYYGNIRNLVCKRTSYNTTGNVHSAGEIPFRKNYAGIGYKYDTVRDAFIAPKPFNSWLLNEDTCVWEAPMSFPADNKLYQWDEETVSWVSAP